MANLTLNGRRFEVAELGGYQSFLLQPRIAPIAAEVAALLGAILDREDIDLKKLAEADKGQALETILALDLDLGEIGAELAMGVSRICAKLPPKELDDIVRTLLAGATMDGKPLFTGAGQGEPIEILMKGRSTDLWRLLYFAVQQNYPDVFSRRALPAASAPANP